jgi:hypothetical protein
VNWLACVAVLLALVLLSLPFFFVALLDIRSDIARIRELVDTIACQKLDEQKRRRL